MHVNVKGNDVVLDIDEIEALNLIEMLTKGLSRLRRYTNEHVTGYQGPTVLNDTIPAVLHIGIERTHI